MKIISENFSEFSGGIYDLNTWTGYGRNYLNEFSTKNLSSKADAEHLYDLIDMPLTGVTVSGNFGISEDLGLKCK